MVAPNIVVVDTCVWASFFNRPNSPTNTIISDLIDQDRAAITGVILTEILMGFKRDPQAEWVGSSLRGLLWIEPTWSESSGAAAIGRKLKSRGHALPLADLTIAAVVLERNLMLATSDPHFDLIEGIRRFEVTG